MSDQQDVSQQIANRFRSLLIGLDTAKQDLPEDKDVELPDFLDQDRDGRQLLRVEKQAQRDKKLNERYYQNFLDKLQDQLNDEVRRRLAEQLQDTEFLYSKLIGVPPHLAEVLDLMSVKAASIGRIEPLVATIPWLVQDLIKMVNMPKYRRTDKQGKVIPVESLRMALSFLGLENLKLVIPSLVFRRWLPQITDPYPNIKLRLWEHAMGSAQSCKKVAELSGVDVQAAFTLGMFHEVGKIAVTRLYFRLFEEVRRDALREAHEAKMKEEHAALSDVVPSGVALQDLMAKSALNISYLLLDKMAFQRLSMASAMQEVAQDKPLKEMSALAQVLVQGRSYNQYRMLKSARLINIEEAKAFLRGLMMPPGALSTLKLADLRHLNLTFDEN